MHLKYVFEAETFDGKVITQTQDDVSEIDKTKSAYYDVLQERVKRFSLIGDGRKITVDLVDGHFEIDGLVIQTEENPIPSKYELIFFRQHQHDTNVSYEAGKVSDVEEIGHRVKYFIGWESRGKRQILGIN